MRQCVYVRPRNRQLICEGDETRLNLADGDELANGAAFITLTNLLTEGLEVSTVQHLLGFIDNTTHSQSGFSSRCFTLAIDFNIFVTSELDDVGVIRCRCLKRDGRRIDYLLVHVLRALADRDGDGGIGGDVNRHISSPLG